MPGKSTGAVGVPDQAPLRSSLLSTSQHDRTIVGLMDRQTTHNKRYATFKEFAMLNFLRNDVPRNWSTYCDEVTESRTNSETSIQRHSGLSCERGIVAVPGPATRARRRIA